MKLIFATLILIVLLVAIFKVRKWAQEKRRKKEYHRARREAREKSREEWQKMYEQWQEEKRQESAGKTE